MQQIQIGIVLVDRTMELELINTWLLTSKKPCPYVIAALSIVDYLTKCNRCAGFREVVAQSHREGSILLSARGSRGSCVRDMGTIIPTVPFQFFFISVMLLVHKFLYFGIMKKGAGGLPNDPVCPWEFFSYRKKGGGGISISKYSSIYTDHPQSTVKNINSPSFHGPRSKAGKSLHWV